MKRLWLLSAFLFACPCYGGFGFRNNLAKPNRELILKTLGLGTLSKNLSQPEPLGTEHGLELALTTEIINTKEIGSFIADSKNDDVLYYPKISVGKGLYNRADFFFHFIPFTSTLGVSEFGGMLRVNAYQYNDFFYTNLIFHANSANFNNQLTTRNLGTDLSLGWAWEHFTATAVVGWANSTGKFIGGSSGVTDTLIDETEHVQSVHVGASGSVRYSIYTFALALDHYSEAVYTAKFGVLF